MIIIDISVPLHAGVPAWPGSPGYVLHEDKSFATDQVMNSRIEMDVHVGTHIDAPLHVLEGATAVDALPLEPFLGAAEVVDLRGHDAINAGLLEERVPAGTSRLLMRTDNGQRWDDPIFDPSFVALTPDAARWIVDAGVQLVANDYLSVQRYEDGSDTHEVLLSAGVVVVEGVDLRAAEPGSYELVCLPLALAGAEGAPARAMLIRR